MFGMKLTLGNGMVTTVSNEDVDLLEAYGWYALKDGNHYYAYANVVEPKRTTVKLHRLVAARVLGDIVGRRIDHVNRDGLDNRRENLRVAGQGENLVNAGKRKGEHSSKYKGVYFHKPSGRWLVQIRLPNVQNKKHLGYFDTQEEAAVAFDRAAMERYGEFEVLNFRWKPCTSCGELKPEIDYPVRKNRRSGRASRCKVCGARAAQARRSGGTP